MAFKGLCPISCGDINLLVNPTSCSTSERYKTLSRVAFFPCEIELPDPIQGSIKPLFDNGTIAVSSELGNFTINDPTTEDVTISNCRPAKRVTTTREIVFQDRIAVSFASGSPAVTNDYWDYLFAKDKLQYENRLYSMWIYCDGDVIIPRDEDDNLLTFSMMGFINWQILNGGRAMEFKQFSMIYQGDPFYFIEPSFNLHEEDISI